MRLLYLFIVLVAGSVCSAADRNTNDTAGDQLLPLSPGDVRVGGEIGRRIDITINNNLLQLNIDRDFLSSFQKKNDAGYIGLGKLIDGVVRMAAYNGDARIVSLMNHLTSEVIKAQEPDGYIGNMSVKKRMWTLWDIHEMGYIINGLNTGYRLFGDKKSLAAAVKAADYIIRNWSTKPAGWENTTGVKEHVAITGLHRTILNLYLVTNDRKYLDFCLDQLHLADLDPGIVIGRRNLIEGHIYGYMAACLAQLELYRIRPDERLLGPTMESLNFMTSHNGLSITGGAGQSEIWTDDQDGRSDLGESCATAYQLRVYDNLLRLRGDSRFGDIMERTIHNALFGAQSPDGRLIRYFTPLEGNRVYHKGDTYCCPCNYRRFISELPLMLYYVAGNGVAVNLYSQSEALMKLERDLTVNIRQDTDYPSSGNVIITVNPSREASFAMKLRIPLWCRNAVISINGTKSAAVCRPGTFATVERTWKKGDKIVLDMPMDWRLVLGRQRQAGRVAVMRGPLLFCLNPAQNESLAGKDGADLGRIVIDIKSIASAPSVSSVIHPGGIACNVKACNVPMAISNTGNLSLTLTEFADPDGKCTYFTDPDLSEAVPDELTGIW
jgi:uncharacterized protein